MHIGAKALGIVFDKSHLTPMFMHYCYNVSYMVINGYIGHIWFNCDTRMEILNTMMSPVF